MSYWPTISQLNCILACYWSFVLYDVFFYRHYKELHPNTNVFPTCVRILAASFSKTNFIFRLIQILFCHNYYLLSYHQFVYISLSFAIFPTCVSMLATWFSSSSLVLRELSISLSSISSSSSFPSTYLFST